MPSEAWQIELEIKQARLTATERLIRVIATVINPVAEATVGHAALVVAGPEPSPAAPVVWTHGKQQGFFSFNIHTIYNMRTMLNALCAFLVSKSTSCVPPYCVHDLD